jgi:hypothetical protein
MSAPGRLAACAPAKGIAVESRLLAILAVFLVLAMGFFNGARAEDVSIRPAQPPTSAS